MGHVMVQVGRRSSRNAARSSALKRSRNSGGFGAGLLYKTKKRGHRRSHPLRGEGPSVAPQVRFAIDDDEHVTSSCKVPNDSFTPRLSASQTKSGTERSALFHADGQGSAALGSSANPILPPSAAAPAPTRGPRPGTDSEAAACHAAPGRNDRHRRPRSTGGFGCRPRNATPPATGIRMRSILPGTSGAASARVKLRKGQVVR